MVTHGVLSNNIDRQIQVSNHLLNDRQLLSILLAEVDVVWSDSIQEFDNNCGNSIKVAWATFSFELCCDVTSAN